MTIVNAVEIAPQNNRTIINIVLDETGSMNSCRDSTISSFNEYINSQKNLEGECLVSLTMFSLAWGSSPETYVRDSYRNLPISNVPDLTPDKFVPNGGTNLYDAIGSTIRRIEKTVDSRDNILVVIITDGDENSSREYTLDSIKTLVSEKEKEGWTFVYLGANQDAWQVGARFGLSKGQTMTYDVANMAGTMATLNAATTSYRSVRVGGMNAASVEKNFFGDDNAKS